MWPLPWTAAASLVHLALTLVFVGAPLGGVKTGAPNPNPNPNPNPSPSPNPTPIPNPGWLEAHATKLQQAMSDRYLPGAAYLYLTLPHLN